MNVYDWMEETEGKPPLNEPGTREDPGNRPHVPDDEDGTTRELHSNAGGGRVTGDTEQHKEITIVDPEDTVSNEGVIESVRKLFGIHNRGKKFIEIDGNASASIGKIHKTIEGTFASKEWLDKQTPVKHDVKVSDLLEDLNLKNLVSSVQETFAINLSFAQAVDRAQLEVIKHLQPVLKLWDARKLTDKAYEKTSEALNTIPNVLDVIKKPTRTKTNLLPSKGEPTASPLSTEAMLELATAILTCIKTDVARIENQNDELDQGLGGFSEAHFEIVRNDLESESYNSQAWEKLTTRVLEKLSHSGIQEALQGSRQFSATCIAAVIYMERSIKGGKATVANEQHIVSNEGLIDALKDLFKAKPKELAVDESVDKHSIDKLKDTLLNDSWLKKQTITEGKVTVRFPDAAMDGNYQPVVKRIKEELERTGKHNGIRTDAWAKPISAAVVLITEGNVKGANTEQVEKLLKSANFEELDFDVDHKEPNNFLDDDAEVELPSLDIAGVKTATNAVIDLIKARDEYISLSMGSFPMHIDYKRMHLIRDVNDKQLKEALLKLYDEVDGIQEYFVELFFQNQYAYWDLVESMATGLMRWIEKSITGVKVNSNE